MVENIGLKGGDAGPYVVSLYPGGVLGLRRARSRKEFQVSLASCYRLAAMQAAAALARERKEERKAARAARRPAR